jgi:hypothetical protein
VLLKRRECSSPVCEEPRFHLRSWCHDDPILCDVPLHLQVNDGLACVLITCTFNSSYRPHSSFIDKALSVWLPATVPTESRPDSARTLASQMKAGFYHIEQSDENAPPHFLLPTLILGNWASLLPLSSLLPFPAVIATPPDPPNRCITPLPYMLDNSSCER